MLTVKALSDMVGVSEAALRLLLSIILSYPIGFAYRRFIHSSQPKTVCQLFLTLSGVALYLFNYGLLIYHSVLAVVATFLFIQFLPAKTLLVPVSFVFHMGYLLIGYIFTTTDDYDITWTMPHCVLALRLIGLAFDISDGTLPEEKQSKDMKRLAIKPNELPDLLELATFSFFPASFLVGPQFGLERLRRFLNREFDQYSTYVSGGLKRLGLGFFYLALNQALSLYVPDAYLSGEEYANKNMLIKCFHLAIWGKAVIYKYASCWILAEGGVTMFGLSYNGKTASGEEDWNACENFKPIRYETGQKFQHYIEAFNIQTNHWVAHYVYKRLKFLGDKSLSFIGTLLFLAVWHGFHSGYYMTFTFEFLSVTMEKSIEPVFDRNETLSKLMKNPVVNAIKYIICQLYCNIFGAWNLVPFVFLQFNKWWPIFRALNYAGLILFVPGPFVIGPVLKAIFPPTRRAVPEEAKKAE